MAKSVLFSDCLKRYIKEGLPLQKRSTRQGYATRFRYLTTGPLHSVKMKELNSELIYNWIKWLKKQKTIENPMRKTFLKELELLKIVLNWYKNFVDANFNVPITKKHRQICYYKIISPKRPDYYAKPEELRAWIKWLTEKRSNPVYWRLALFMTLTGARVSEACGLCWECIDFKRSQAIVVQKMAWDHSTKKPYLEEVTKTDSSVRLLMLPEELIKILKIMKKENEYRYNNKLDLLFVGSNGEALKYNAVQAAFNAGFRALNLPWRSTHILRHSYATGALIATQNISAVQASLGHSSSRMTERYAKVIALLDHAVAEKTARFFNIFDKQRKAK